MSSSHASPPRSRPGRSRRVHGALFWDIARRDYLAGADPAFICERMGLNRSTFRDRARREGWRRQDIFEDAPPWTQYDEAGLRRDPDFLAISAWSNAARAVMRNRRLEARAWLLVAQQLGATPDRMREIEEMHSAQTRRDTAPSGAPAESGLYAKTNTSDDLTAESAESVPETLLGALEVGQPAAAPPEAAAFSSETEPPAPEPESERAAAPVAHEAPEGPDAPDTRPPWTTLLFRPEAACTWNEKAVRRRILDHGLNRLIETDRPEALRRWAAWVQRFDIDPHRPPDPPEAPAPRRPVYDPCSGLRVVLP
jgi:hypothetical protein